MFDSNKRQMFANCLLLPDISMTSEEWPTCLQTTASKGCTSFPPSPLSVRPPWNTVGVSGHSFHCVRTGLRSEETVNGHLEVGENICLWRHGGLVIPQWDLASHVFLLSLLMDFSIVLSVLFFVLTKSKSCRYLSICWRENHPSSDHIRQLICLIWLFFFNRFSIQCFSYHGTAKQRSTKTVYICLWGPRARYPAAAAVMGSGWTPSLVSMTYESAAWVQCHLRISWTGLHISKTPCSAGQIAVLLLLNPAPYISSALQLTLDFTVFVFFYYMLCLFFSLSTLRS